jgi:acyl-CoA thioesterase-1
LRGWLRAVLVVVLLLVVTVRMLNHASAKVAFMGDSLTAGWSFPRANFGIKGQTTAQMVDRFPAEICWKGYREVVILGGTNDTLLGIDPKVTVANLGMMADFAKAAGVKPVLAEIPPIYRNDGQYMFAVKQLNAGILGLAKARGLKLVDYYDALDGHPGAYSDGVHLKGRGYLRMEWALTQEENPF